MKDPDLPQDVRGLVDWHQDLIGAREVVARLQGSLAAKRRRLEDDASDESVMWGAELARLSLEVEQLHLFLVGIEQRQVAWLRAVLGSPEVPEPD